MTNDEAIYTLKNTAFLGWSEQAEKVSEAVRMAVEALKAQLTEKDTTSDCISRQAAIDEAEEWIEIAYRERVRQRERDAIRHVIKGIKKLPPAQPERKTGRWIPQDHNKTTGMTSTAVYYYPKCSVCGHCGNYTNFCPRCGADMRGEHDG